MMEEAKRAGALSSYRALDLTNEKGLFCGKILGDLGVDVVKIEKPGGDSARKIGPFYQDVSDPDKSLFWWAFNTSKRGITLDIETSAGRDLFKKLVGNADFVLESFTPGTMSKFGLGYRELSKINPGIILVSISGFGQEGPYSRYKAPDIVCMAMGGMMNLTGDLDKPPLRLSVPQAYLHASNDAATGALIALWHKLITGQGQHVDVSAQESMTWMGFTNLAHLSFEGIKRKRAGPIFWTPPREFSTYPLFQCKDGAVHLQIFAGPITERILGLIDWMEEEGMADEFLKTVDWTSDELSLFRPEIPKAELDHVLRIVKSFEPFIQTKTKRELFDQAIARGFLLAPINSIKEVFEDEHFRARGFWKEIDHPELGEKITYPGAPVGTRSGYFQVRNRAPLIGEHNAEILHEDSYSSSRENMTPIWEHKDSTSAFDELKVVEFSWYITGPRTARYFADHGATVVKVEGPGRYDGGRDVGPYREKVVHVDRSGFFTLYNVNKYSISIDLKAPEGIELTERLIQWADVLIESFTPGVMKKLGFDYNSVKKINPSIIYASTSMMGQAGPYSLFTGFGTHATGICGFGDMTGWPNRMPSCPFWAYTDHIGPQLMASAILTALIDRRRTGEGQYIDQAQNESALHFLAPALLDYAVNRRIATRDGNRNPRAAPHGAYPCKGDDRWCVIAVHTDQDWRSLCKIMGFPPWTKNMKFANLHSRKQNEDELDRLIGEWTIQFSAEILMTKLQKAGIAAGVVQNAEDLQNDPQLKYRNHFLTYDHESNGAFIVDALPPKFSETPSKQYMPSPSLGQHNFHVCTQILGLSDEVFVELVEKGCFG